MGALKQVAAAVGASVVLLVGSLAAAAGPVDRGAAQVWLFSCGGPPYPLSLFDQPVGAERDHNPASRALRQLIRHPNGIETLPAKSWRRGPHVRNYLSFVARRPGAPSGLFEVTFKRSSKGNWHYQYSSHYCTLMPSVENRGVGRWSLDPNFPSPEPDQTEIHVLVEGSYCTSGAPPALADPLISFGKRRVVIASLEKPPKGSSHTCEGGPPVAYTFNLGEPIGSRVVLDGFFFPFEKRIDFRP